MSCMPYARAWIESSTYKDYIHFYKSVSGIFCCLLIARYHSTYSYAKENHFFFVSLFLYGFPLFRPALMLSSYIFFRLSPFHSEKFKMVGQARSCAEHSNHQRDHHFSGCPDAETPRERVGVSTPINCDPFDGHRICSHRIGVAMNWQ